MVLSYERVLQKSGEETTCVFTLPVGSYYTSTCHLGLEDLGMSSTRPPTLGGLPLLAIGLSHLLVCCSPGWQLVILHVVICFQMCICNASGAVRPDAKWDGVVHTSNPAVTVVSLRMTWPFWRDRCSAGIPCGRSQNAHDRHVSGDG